MISDREHIGNLHIENHRLLVEYRNLLGLVEQIGAGTIQPDQVVVDAENLSWSLKMTGEDSPEASEKNE